MVMGVNAEAAWCGRVLFWHEKSILERTRLNVDVVSETAQIKYEFSQICFYTLLWVWRKQVDNTVELLELSLQLTV